MSEGYLKLRRGIETHLELGYINGFEFGIYCYLLLKADYQSGVVRKTSAVKLSEVLGFNIKTLRKYLKSLEEKNYIKRFIIKGSTYLYPILVNKYYCEGKGRVDSDKTLSIHKIAYVPDSDEGSDEGSGQGSDVGSLYIKEVKKKRNKETKGEIVFPISLQNDQFMKSWEDWEAYRIEIKKPLTSKGIERQLIKLEGYGPAGAVQAIRQSIDKEWRGIFPPENGKKENMIDVKEWIKENITKPKGALK